jgi:two-component system, LytTR family, response regulator
MTSLRVLVVDDVELARQKIVRLLTFNDGIEVIGTAANGMEMIDAVARLRPTLLMLDISMPEQDGISALLKIPSENRPLVIFVTAHEEFALTAFRVNAVDYLLKPIEPALLTEGLARARRRLAEGMNQSSSKVSAASPPVRITVRTDTGLRVVLLDDINWVEAVRNYVAIHLPGETLIVRSTLQRILGQLDPLVFAYAHRSAVVNVRKVRELRPFGNGDQRMWLHDGTQLSISRSCREALLCLLAS